MPVRLTIGVPVYNGERYIEQTISSLLHQTYSDFVLIIADNASSDSTEEICRALQREDSRIAYLRHPENIGIFRNYDYVFHKAKTQYFKWSSSNDLYHREFLSTCIEVLDSRPEIALAVTRTLLFDSDPERGEPVPPLPALDDPNPVQRFIKLSSSLKLNNAMNGVLRRDLMARTSLNGVYMGSDLNMMGELILLGCFAEIPEYYFFRRQSRGAHSKAAASISEFFAGEPRDVVRRAKLEYLFQKFIGVMKLPVPLQIKLSLLPHFARRFWWSRSDLVAEIWSRPV